jgi:hypothetical protein
MDFKKFLAENELPEFQLTSDDIGKVATFIYYKIAGIPERRTGTIVYLAQEYLKLHITNEGPEEKYRTFRFDRMKNLRLVDGSEW